MSDSEHYQGGVTLRRDGNIDGSVGLLSRFGDIDLSVTCTSGRGCSTSVAGLKPDEAREVATALCRAAGAAEAYRTRTEQLVADGAVTG